MKEVEAPSIGVLPFANMSADADNEYFSDGITEEILNALSRVPTINVASRTSSFALKGKSISIAEVGQLLNVRTVLEGSVRRMGHHVRISAQLVSTADGLKGGVFPPDYDLECYRAVAAAVAGDRVRFDPNAVWTAEQAVRFGRAIEDLDNDYLEDPVFGLTGMRHVREKLRIPLATNTVVVNFEQLAANVLNRAVDVILLDTTFWGGIRPCVRAAGVCDTFQLGVAVHSSGELGVQLATMLHLGAVVPNLGFAADAHYHHLADDIIEGGKLAYDHGAIRVPDGPGLGVRLDRNKLARYAEMYRELGSYPYDQDPGRPGWAPLVPNDRWADPKDEREPFVR